jgi:hypothetical protein
MLAMKWIDVKKELPKEGSYVLAIDNEDYMWIVSYNKSKGFTCPQEGWGMKPTHWMALPESPRVN